jgi:hypothetical protein
VVSTGIQGQCPACLTDEGALCADGVRRCLLCALSFSVDDKSFSPTLEYSTGFGTWAALEERKMEDLTTVPTAAALLAQIAATRETLLAEKALIQDEIAKRRERAKAIDAELRELPRPPIKRNRKVKATDGGTA